MNKSNKISYITMFMLLLYNIAKINNTVTVQCSVSMYTEEFTQYLSFRITKGATRPVSSDLKTHSVPSLSPCVVPWSQCTCSLLRLAQRLSVSVNTN